MKNDVLRSVLFVLALSCCIFFAVSQKPAISDTSLRQQYADAQYYYDKATSLSDGKTYGAKEEALEKEWNKKALSHFETLYQQIPANQSHFDSLRFYTSFKIGELQHYFENFNEAVFYYRSAISIQEKSSLPDSLLFKPYLYAGIIYYNQNKFDTAVQLFKKAEKIQAVYGNQLAEGERLYNILGVLHYERGNYRQAQNYFQKAIALLPATNPYYDELYVNYQINLAQICLRLEEYDKANRIYQLLLPKKINLNEIHHNIGSLNLSLGAAAKALLYFRKVHYQNNKVVRLYNSMGTAFFNLNQFDSASYYYQKAVNAYDSLGTNSDPVGYGLVLKNLGDYQVHFKKYHQSLSYFQKAIHQFYPSFTNEDIHANPQQFSGIFSYINLFSALNAKANAWHQLYLVEKDIRLAKEELQVYQSAFKLIEYVERTYDSDEARLFLSKIKHAVHAKPIDIAFELYTRTNDKNYLNLLYHFDQQNKAAALSLNRQLNTVLSETSSPLLQKEQEIKSEITRLSIRATQLTDSTQLAPLNNLIRDKEIELGRLQETLNQKAALSDGGNIPPIESLQTKLLDKKSALISYHLAEGKLTRIVITKNTVRCQQTMLPADFSEKLEMAIVKMKSPAFNTDTSETINYFSLFLGGVDVKQLDQLIIIPDDLLNYFPFESLQDNDGRYLVQDVAVQYQFSTALLSKNDIDFSGATTLSLAPFSHRGYRDSLPQLPHSIREISSLKGLQFFDTAATKRNFLKYSSQYKIVHLATHAVAGNQGDALSYIAFAQNAATEDRLLYAQEIYDLRLQHTGLIFLSACETGEGQLVKGEGVLSLSRAFSYAGCPNIITTLWKADDFSTAYITSRVHHYLNESFPISKAVQKAKIDYLNDKHINPRLKQPYYWSHIVFIGNYDPGKAFPWTWVIIIGVVTLFVFFMIIKMRGKVR